jgi:hypothetical protein
MGLWQIKLETLSLDINLKHGVGSNLKLHESQKAYVSLAT